MNKRVKIVATLGPAVEIRGGKKFGDDGYWGEKLDVEASAKNIAQLIEAGANTFRFNFSHGDHQEQGDRMATVKLAEKLAGKKVGFLLDTKGPEIRTELFEGDAKEYSYKTGEKIRVATKQGIKSTREVIALNVAGALDIYDDVEVGRQVLVDDGKLGLRVVEKDDATREFVCEVENDGVIAKQKGVNIPNTKIPFPALAERDNADIRFGLEQGINFIAISFVRTAKDVNEVRAICEETGNGHVQLFAKIENQQGIENLDEIIEAADGIMIARGDMGIEVPFEMVPVYQKMIITKVNAAGKVVITATNMLETMTEKPRATRSEVSDVFNAVIDGTDATMLSGESANGKYPLESVRTMATIDKNAQTLLNEYGRLNSDTFERNSKTEVMASAVKDATNSMDIKLVVTLTKTGHTARLISKYRPNADIRFGLEQGINFIAISFVRTAKDVQEVRAICEETGNGHVQLLAKIENQQGIDNIDEIIEAADGIMIARGDMGIEVPFEMVPVYQKMIITKVNAAGKVVVTATNMLETMTEKPRATRSEVSDVFNAVIDGTDATMLSGESANGKYPVESVRTMATIDKNAQTLLKEYGRLDSSTFDRSTKTEVVASAVKDATNSMDIKLVVALTESGNTARLISKYRPEADILAVTFDEITQKSLMLNWGVIPVVTEKPSSTDDMFDVAEKVALESGLVESGDNIVIVAGVPVGTGGTNTMRIRTVK